ncbi:AfsR/SARP family transcriptional regulator [Saccharothrix texasensis]|uniref:DNA-binding SARP family transcriptional activator n=1 Tax=Saccharothrix texasensis TaxID=103734 RepID=A0A3N1H6J5_9PSEU|nr:tetratricopeptide repeat protein [Saccharothrix texasensis]ROP38046.1 DNA-binding SARP family transcriptional activator [Saccharothrix texasensis]
MEFKIIGKTRLHVDGNDQDLGAAKQRGVLTLLLYHFPSPVQVDTLTRVLWPGVGLDQVKRTLQPIISRLRSILSKVQSGVLIRKEGNAYRLVLEPPEVIDYYRFRKLAERGREAAVAGDHRRAKTLLQEALSLWQDRPLQELEGTWADRCRDQMETFDRLPAFHALLDSRQQLGEHLEVVAEAGRLMAALDPDEAFAALYIRSLDALGRHSAALDFYAGFCRRLFEHVGAEPGPQLRDLYKRILRKQAGTATAPVEPPRQLPRKSKNFTGRVDLLDRLDALLNADDGQGQVVALHGMPGVGKSELALHWAHRHADRFPDGTLYLDLRGFGPGTPMEPEEALSMLLRSLGTEQVPQNGDERRAALRRSLGTRRVLLVLDDVQDSGQVRPVLSAAANSFTIITSRTRLVGLKVRDHVDLIRVPTLSVDESVAFLRNEIGDARPHDEPDALRSLASRADGHPLALSIIAQHVAQRPEAPITELVDEFVSQEGLGVLGSVHDSDDESVTLPVAFSWSFRYLSPDTARVFRLLGLHPTAEFSTDATSVLLGQPADVVTRHLSALARSNLLEYGSPRRFRLHDMLHGYAVDLVRHHEPAAVRRDAMARLLDWYLASSTAAARLLDPQSSPVPPLPGMTMRPFPLADESEALAWLTRERANLVGAVHQAVRHDFNAHAWRLSANLHEAYDRMGHFEEALISHRSALKAAKALGDLEAVSGTHSNLGMVLYRLQRFAEARDHFEAGMETAQAAGATELHLICAHNLAAIHLALGETSTAIALYGEILASVRELGYRDGEAYALDQLANAYRKVDRDDLALEHYYQALAIRREIGHVRGEATTLTELGMLHHERGEQDQALHRLQEALDVHSHSGDRTRKGEALVTIAEVEFELDLFDEAIEHAEQAAALCEELGAHDDHGRALRVWGQALAALGGLDEAEVRWRRAADVLREVAEVEAAEILDHLDNLKRIRAIPEPREGGVVLEGDTVEDGHGQ